MPTIITHSIVGLAAGKLVAVKKMKARFWILSIICPVLPDLDVVAFRFGISYGHFLGHRGFFHSLFFAFILSLFVVLVFFRDNRVFTKNRFLILFYFFLITGSHGLLDAFTSGGLGIALLSPFDNTRYFFPTTPILVSPLSIEKFMNQRGLKVLMSEALWIWLPLLVTIIITGFIRRLAQIKKKFSIKKD